MYGKSGIYSIHLILSAMIAFALQNTSSKYTVLYLGDDLA